MSWLNHGWKMASDSKDIPLRFRCDIGDVFFCNKLSRVDKLRLSILWIEVSEEIGYIYNDICVAFYCRVWMAYGLNSFEFKETKSVGFIWAIRDKITKLALRITNGLFPWKLDINKFNEQWCRPFVQWGLGLR